MRLCKPIHLERAVTSLSKDHILHVLRVYYLRVPKEHFVNKEMQT